ncbi:hypothetical protein [Helicobacter sp. 23-1045]
MRESSVFGNLFWGMQFAPFLHKTSLDEPQVLSRLFHAKTAQSHTAITSIVICKANQLYNSSLRDLPLANRGNPQNNYLDFAFAESSPICHTKQSEVSQKKRDSSLRALHFAQNDNFVDCHENATHFLAMTKKCKNPQNLTHENSRNPSQKSTDSATKH